MSFYLGWLIKKVSGVLPFDMVYGFVGPCFPAVDSSAKTEGNFPLPSLRKGSQAICVPGSQGNKPCLGSTGFQAGGDCVGDLRCLELGRGLKPGRGWLVLWLERGAHRALEVMRPGVGHGYRDVVKARDTKLLSLRATAILCGLVRRQCSCRTYQPSRGLSRFRKAASCVVTSWTSDRGLFPSP